MAHEQSPEIKELRKKLDANADSLVFAPLAEAYRKDGDLNEALAVCKRGLEKHPQYESARVVLGRIYQDQGKVEEALAEFKKVLEGDPENFMAHTLIGNVFMQKKEYQSAIEEYQRVLTLNPDDETVPGLLKEAIEKAARDAKPREKKTSSAEKKSPSKESTASLTLAELYYKQGHFDKAVEMYQDLLASDPQNQILRQKLNETVEKQEESLKASGKGAKKDAFTKPPDHKEETLAEGRPSDEAGRKAAKSKDKDDIKFTSEDILQVMQRGGKDDVMVEEKAPVRPAASAPPPAAKPAPPVEKPAAVEAPSKPIQPLTHEQIGQVKGVLAEISATEGILGSLFAYGDGEPAVTVGPIDGDPKILGQMAAGIFDSARKSVQRLQQGRLQQVLVTAGAGYVILFDTTRGHLVVLANDKIKMGLLRLALEPAVKKLEKFF